MKATMRDLEQFTSAVKVRLTQRLQGVSLELVDLGLQQGKSAVVTPGVDILVLAGWVKRPITGEIKEFKIRFGADIGEETGLEEVDPLCSAVVQSCLEQFFAKKEHAVNVGMVAEA